MTAIQEIKELSTSFAEAVAIMAGGALIGTAVGLAYYYCIPRSEFVPQTINDLPQEQCMPGMQGIPGPCRAFPRAYLETRLKEIKGDPAKYLEQRQVDKSVGIGGLVMLIFSFGGAACIASTPSEKGKRDKLEEKEIKPPTPV